MRRPWELRGSCFVWALVFGVWGLAPSHVRASEPLLPGPETGLVGVLAGVRYVPQSGLFSDSERQGAPLLSRMPVTPALGLPFLYRVNTEWAVFVEFGWSPDRYRFQSQGQTTQLDVQTLTLLLGGQRTFDFGWKRVEPYLGFGVGYFLSSVTLDGPLGELEEKVEAHAAGGYAAVGLRIGVGGGWSLLVEERYAVSMAGLGDYSNLTVGGNTVSLGVSRVWR